MFIRVDPGTGARIFVCSGCAVASKTGECPPITASRSEFHVAGLDATCQGKSAETSGSRLKKRKAVAALLESPNGKKKSTTVPWADLESPRSKLLQKLAQDLECPKFTVYFQAILTCRQESVLSAEAKENCLDRKLMQLLARDKSLPVKLAAQHMLKFWAASQLVSSISLFHVFN